MDKMSEQELNRIKNYKRIILSPFQCGKFLLRSIFGVLITVAIAIIKLCMDLSDENEAEVASNSSSTDNQSRNYIPEIIT